MWTQGPGTVGAVRYKQRQGVIMEPEPEAGGGDTEPVVVAPGYQPVGRRGACCFSRDGAIYILQGHEDSFPPPSYDVEKTLCRFLLKEGKWDFEIKTKTGISSAVSGSCCCLSGDGEHQYLVTFGGWKSGRRVADVHMLDLKEMQWTKCGVNNPAEGPFLKDKAGMVPYGDDMVCVIGGYGYPSEHHIHSGVYHGQKGAQYYWDHVNDLCWTNEVHLFCFKTGMWITPQISGQGPPPCAAFTFTMADSCRAVLFGGRQVNRRVNDLYMLYLDDWHWEGVFLKSSPTEPWPSERSFHTMCSLVETSFVSSVFSHQRSSSAPLPTSAPRRIDWLPCTPPNLSSSCTSSTLRPRLLLLWGMDNEGDPVPDCWTLELDPITWKKVTVPAISVCQPRLWHVAGVWHPTPSEAHVVVFGGTKDNIYSATTLDVCRTVNNTVVFLCGVPTLHTLCVNFLALLPETALAELPSILPEHIARTIVQQATAIRHSHHFPFIKL